MFIEVEDLLSSGRSLRGPELRTRPREALDEAGSGTSLYCIKDMRATNRAAEP